MLLNNLYSICICIFVNYIFSFIFLIYFCIIFSFTLPDMYDRNLRAKLFISYIYIISMFIYTYFPSSYFSFLFTSLYVYPAYLMMAQTNMMKRNDKAIYFTYSIFPTIFSVLPTFYLFLFFLMSRPNEHDKPLRQKVSYIQTINFSFYIFVVLYNAFRFILIYVLN